MGCDKQRLSAPRPAPGAVRRAFVLLEVLISLTILTVTVAATLRSFSQSLVAVRQLEVRTQSNFFLRQLMDEFEINPPEEGTLEGGFGDDYWQYYFTGEVEYEYPIYDERNESKDVEQFFPMRIVHLEIHYDNGRNKAFRAGWITTAIMGFERFSWESKMQFSNF